MKIVEVCNRNVVTTVARASLADVAKLMRESHVGSVIVVDPPGSGIPVGIVTDRDIVVEAVAADLDVVQAIGTERFVEGQRRGKPA